LNFSPAPGARSFGCCCPRLGCGVPPFIASRESIAGDLGVARGLPLLILDAARNLNGRLCSALRTWCLLFGHFEIPPVQMLMCVR